MPKLPLMSQEAMKFPINLWTIGNQRSGIGGLTCRPQGRTNSERGRSPGQGWLPLNARRHPLGRPPRPLHNLHPPGRPPVYCFARSAHRRGGLSLISVRSTPRRPNALQKVSEGSRRRCWRGDGGCRCLRTARRGHWATRTMGRHRGAERRAPWSGRCLPSPTAGVREVLWFLAAWRS